MMASSPFRMLCRVIEIGGSLRPTCSLGTRVRSASSQIVVAAITVRVLSTIVSVVALVSILASTSTVVPVTAVAIIGTAAAISGKLIRSILDCRGGEFCV